MIYLNHRKDDTRCTDEHQELRQSEIKKDLSLKTLLTFGKNEKKSSYIKTNPLKGKRRKKEVLKGTKNLYTKAAPEHPNKKKERLK